MKTRVLAPFLFIAFNICCCSQSPFIYFPERELSAHPGDEGLRFEWVTLTAADGVRLSGWWVPAVSPKGTVIFFHGNAGNISHRLHHLKLFNRFQMNTFIFDYRGYGKSEGSPDEEGIRRDAMAAWDHCVTDRKIRPESILLFGRSLGGSVAAWLASRAEPGALVLDSTFPSIGEVARHHCLPSVLFIRFGYHTGEYARKARCPLLILHSRDDETIPFTLGRKLSSALPEAEFIELRGGHNNGFIVSRKLYEKSLEKFIGRHFPAKP